MKKSIHGRNLSQILILGKWKNYNKNGLNNLFASSTSKMLLTVADICIYILRRKKYKSTRNDLMAKISVLRYSNFWRDNCLSDCCNNGKVYPYLLNMDRFSVLWINLFETIWPIHPPILSWTDESFTRFCLNYVWISCWHMLNPQLRVECFETWFDSGYFNSLFRLYIVFKSETLK